MAAGQGEREAGIYLLAACERCWFWGGSQGTYIPVTRHVEPSVPEDEDVCQSNPVAKALYQTQLSGLKGPIRGPQNHVTHLGLEAP